MPLTTRELAVLRWRKQGLTQAVVAKRLRMSQSAISDFECNAYRKILDAERIIQDAHRLQITVPSTVRRRMRP